MKILINVDALVARFKYIWLLCFSLYKINKKSKIETNWDLWEIETILSQSQEL